MAVEPNELTGSLNIDMSLVVSMIALGVESKHIAYIAAQPLIERLTVMIDQMIENINGEEQEEEPQPTIRKKPARKKRVKAEE